jgi:taurine--2-oxoglutarate transaminase
MPETRTLSETKEIVQDNLDYTLFSWSKQKGIDPIAVQRAEGVYLYDYDGKRYLDFSSGLMNVNIGHGHPRVTEAVVRQMQEVSYVTPGCVTRVRGELGKKLAEITPGNLQKTLFTTDGASSIDNAIKLARLYTGRHKIIARYRAFHGASYGSMSAGGDPRKLPADAQQAPNFVHVEDPYCYRCPWGKEIETCHPMCPAHRTGDRIRRPGEYCCDPDGRGKRDLRVYQVSAGLPAEGQGALRQARYPADRR